MQVEIKEGLWKVKIYSEGMSNAPNDLMPSGLMSFEPIELQTPTAKTGKGNKRPSLLQVARVMGCQPRWWSARVKTATQPYSKRLKTSKESSIIPSQLF